VPPRWEKEREVKTHTPIGAVARRVGVVFATDLDADWLPPNLKNLADLKNDGDSPFTVVGGSVPIRRRFRINGEGRMGLRRVGNERLDEHLTKTAAMLLDYN
jgi:hypothetical protein